MASHIERRKFLATLGGAAATWPLAARAHCHALLRFLSGAVGKMAVSAFGGRLNEGGFGLHVVFRTIHTICLSALDADRAMEEWYHPSVA
jgi:hypothetical protein